MSRAAKAIVAGGGIAGILDLAYAILVYTPSAPILIPQTIASGVLGQRSYNGGAATVLLGVFLHFFIACSAAAIYWFAGRKLRFLTRNAVASGLAYGAIVYAVMHIIVVPLSAVPKGNGMPLDYKIFEFLEHTVFVGLPIALATRYFARSSSP